MLKLMDTNKLEVGSTDWQQAMEHNILTKVKAGETFHDLTGSEKIFFDIQIDHLQKYMTERVDYIKGRTCNQGFEEKDDESIQDFREKFRAGKIELQKMEPCMECEHSCIVKSALEEN